LQFYLILDDFAVEIDLVESLYSEVVYLFLCGMCFNYGLNIMLLTFLPKKWFCVDFLQFFMYFSHSYGDISKKRILPDMCYKSNFSSNLGLKCSKFWEKSLEPFSRKWPRSVWPNGHFLDFRQKDHASTVVCDFKQRHLKAGLNTFPTIPTCFGSINYFGHSGHLNIGHFWPFGGRPRPRWRPNRKVSEQKSLSFWCYSIPESLNKIRNNYVQTDGQTKLLSQKFGGDAEENFQNAISSEPMVRFRRSWYRCKGIAK